ncbi:intraflagellar transport protein IFT88 [Strigomonas culicis]|uniref:Intraflagellar transport protein IFT88 n=1 Tax=Strigomonas culicis TaxID=28005 RepID=S9V3D6_9TRYP|nr:intraflagellar transport protein IFT88 [Strigomonas culicis]|eukprot:EPY35529.1 intraflagellar transport protein IFT88 [Strigomonas culicis]
MKMCTPRSRRATQTPTVGERREPLWWGPPMSGGGGNPLAQAPPSQWGATGIGSAWGAPGSRLGTMGGALAGAARPMTSNRPVGFSAAGNANMFDPTYQGRMAGMALGPAPPLKKRSENSPEELCMEMERQVNKLIEESAMLAKQRNFGAALERAKEAGKKDRALCKQREQLGFSEQINVDLTYAVHFNLAVQYQNHELYTEALNTYSLIIRNTQFSQAGRLRVNMGNIYAAQKKYLLAIKMYRTALDETPMAGKELRNKLYRNIGNCFVKMGQYRDAVNSFETVVESSGDASVAMSLLLCYYALGETEKVKRTFVKMLNSRPTGLDDEEDFEEEEEKKDVLVDDALRNELKERRARYLKTS